VRSTSLTTVAVALALLLPAGRARALDPDKPLSACTVEVWGLRDGLYGTTVQAIDQTADGYLWIAGYGGVARYDGARIIHLPIEPPGDIAGIAADARDVLYIAPRRGVIRCASKGALIPCPSTLPPGVNGDQPVFSLDRDRTGTIWVATVGKALAVNLRGQAAAAARVEGPFGDVLTVRRDPRDEARLWVAGTNGLFTG
jgi:ligand-binding sensor domain-containing protein